MEFEFAWRPLIIGVLTGAICVGGLYAGLKLLLKTQANESLSQGQRVRNFMLSAGSIGGQLILALLILFKTRAGQDNPLIFGLGLVGSTILFSLLSKLKSNA